MPIPQTVILNAYQGIPGIGVPTGGTSGQVLAKASSTPYDTKWVDVAGTSVTSFNGRTGAVVPTSGDYTATLVGATTIGAAIFGLTNPSAITFLRMNADNTASALSASAFRTAIGAGTGDGDMTLAGVQTVTGAKSFNSTKLILNGSTSGTTTLNSAATAGTSVLTLPAGTGTLLSTISAVTVAQGGTGATTLTGYVKASGTSAMTAAATVPYADLSGVGDMATQSSNAVSISGGAALFTNNQLGINDTAVNAGIMFGVVNTHTAFRTLTFDLSNANRTLTIPANATISGSNTGDQTITLTGDVTGSGTGSFAATIANNAVTLAKMATQASLTVLGNATGGSAVPTAMSASTTKTLLAITNTDVSGLGTMSTQNANAVTISGGSITGITDLAVADGGTGASTAAGARTNLGLGTMAVQDASAVAITGGTITGLGSAIPVASGGTGAVTHTSGNYLKGAGTSAITSVATIPNTDITGLGTMSTQAASAVAITGGTINGTTIGATTATIGLFTTIGATGVASFADGTVSLPSLAFTSDPDTGIYRVSANVLGLTAGGVQVAQFTTTGTYATAIIAGVAISRGAATSPPIATNLAVGNTTMTGNTTGFSNTAYGHNCLDLNSTGGQITAVGYTAGRYVKGDNNAAFGYAALTGNSGGTTTGTANAAFGAASLNKVTTGTENMGVGYGAGFNLTTGSQNCCIGAYALFSATANNYNTAVGESALIYIAGSTSGNTAIGYFAGAYYATATNLTDATDSIFIGRATRAAAATGTNEIVIGINVAGLGSNTTAIGNSSTTATTLYGQVTSDYSTPAFLTPSGKTNTGFLQVSGKTSGALKITTADATAQTLTISAAAQTTGAATITIPDAAGSARTFATLTNTQTFTNKTYSAPILTGDVVADKTITAGGTTGAQTINKTMGSVNFAAAATSLVVTNSLVATTSIIIATVATNDTTMFGVKVVAASGSFTIYANAAATAETRVNFIVLN